MTGSDLLVAYNKMHMLFVPQGGETSVIYISFQYNLDDIHISTISGQSGVVGIQYISRLFTFGERACL